MPRKKQQRGRPPTTHRLPPKADATPEELARAFFKGKPGDEGDFPMVYRCTSCKRVVSLPETLYRDKRCADCTTYSIR